MALLTVAEYEQILGQSLADKDPALAASVIADVCESLKLWCGRSFEVETLTDEKTDAEITSCQGQQVLKLQLRKRPVQSVSAVSVWYNVDTSQPTVIDISSTYIEGELGLVYVAFGLFWTWTTLFPGRHYKAQATYVAGDGTVPGPIKRAAALLAQEQFDLDERNKEGDSLGGLTASISVGEYAETFAQVQGAMLGLGTRNSLVAQRLAAPYRYDNPVFL